MDKPLTEGELTEKIAACKVVVAESTAVEAYAEEISTILSALKEFGIGSAMVTDESCFSDFGLEESELRQVGDMIGYTLNPKNEDDWWLVRVAAKMRHGR